MDFPRYKHVYEVCQASDGDVLHRCDTYEEAVRYRDSLDLAPGGPTAYIRDILEPMFE